jgi:hypothetical protein
MLHDGYTDQLYVLLPVWQSELHRDTSGQYEPDSTA